MKKSLSILVAVLLTTTHLLAQTGASAGQWKTWFISSGKAYRLPPPPSYKAELAEVRTLQQALDSATRQQMLYWSAGAPGYHWYNLIGKLYMTDTSNNVVLPYMLLATTIHDATVVAWDSKYAYQRPRPFAADPRIKALVPKPESPSYPCEHSVAAGVATALVAHFYPKLADSVNGLARQAMDARIAAGVAFPSDTKAGFELGQRIAKEAIERTKDFAPKTAWDGKVPEGPGRWTGKKPMYPMAGKGKTVVLDSSSQFRPGPPPDFAKDMAELKAFKPTFRSMSNAFYWANQDFWSDVLHKKIFEYNLHLDPPRAARLYAIAAVGLYDGFVACWDAKYAYWGIRPNQYDTTYRPPLLVTPPFPGYPSGHASVSGLMGELYSYFFPAEAAYFRQKAKDGAESRFQAGIHFRTDNEVGLELGRKIAGVLIQKVRSDGADDQPTLAQQVKGNGKTQ